MAGPGPGAGNAEVPLVWVDAFCDGPFSGNPAAVCVLERPAPESAMQALARELGLSETAYVWPEGDARALRWFTPAAEVDLCGHATVAAAHALDDLFDCPRLVALRHEVGLELESPRERRGLLGSGRGRTRHCTTSGVARRDAP
jgi:predicted PhzF superfamily epimerase YddE/YHI9